MHKQATSNKNSGKTGSKKISDDKSAVIRFESSNEASEYILTCAQAADRTLDIYTNSLSHEIYADAELVQTLSALARKSRYSQIRVIVQNSRPLHGRRHPLIQLIQRLPSHCDLRILNADYDTVDTGFCIADATSLCFFNNEVAMQGFYCEQAKAESRHALQTFDDIWARYCHHDPEFQTFKL